MAQYFSLSDTKHGRQGYVLGRQGRPLYGVKTEKLEVPTSGWKAFEGHEPVPETSQVIICVSLNGGTPISHPKMIIFSRKTPWLLGTTILGNPHIVGSTPHPVTVTSRIVPCLVGNHYKPSFVTVTGWGVDQTFWWLFRFG